MSASRQALLSVPFRESFAGPVPALVRLKMHWKAVPDPARNPEAPPEYSLFRRNDDFPVRIEFILYDLTTWNRDYEFPCSVQPPIQAEVNCPMAIIGFLYLRLRWRFVLWLLLTILTVVFDGLSISLILPVISASDSIVGKLVNNLFAVVGIEYSLPAVIALIACTYTARNLMFTLQGLVTARSISKLQMDAKTSTMEKIGGTDYQIFSGTGAGRLANAVTMEFNNMATALDHLTNALAFGLFSLSMLLLASMIEPRLLIIVLAISIPCYIGLKKAAGYIQRLSQENTSNNGVIQALMVQMLSAFKYLRATETQERIGSVLRGNIRTQARLLYVQRSFASVLTNATDLTLVLVVLGLIMIYSGAMGKPIIELAFILFIIRRAILYGLQGQDRFQQFLEFYGSIRLFRQLDRELPQKEEPAGSNTVPPDFSQPIEFRNVSFSYLNSGEGLKDLNLTIPPGSKVAIVGPSGAGKSTLVTMLTGILRPTSGVVSLGDTPYSEIDQGALRSQIGYVTQESVIFNDSVENNVSLWDPQVDCARVRRALRASGSEEFVNDLPEGISTAIGDEGAMLSGGQRQRIAIARELYKNARLLICDEGASALESGLEESILSNIDEARGDASVVLVSHRLSITRDADIIYVMEKGRVVEQGSYPELCAAGGIFSEMVGRQTA